MASEAARKARNKYQRTYRKENPDKVRQYNNTFWERRAERELNDIAFQVKQLAKAGLTQRAIAEQLNVSLGQVNRLLNTK